MISATLLRIVGGFSLIVMGLAGIAPAALAQGAKPWRHGVIEPKSDAGFLLMAAKRGFAEREGLKLQILDVKDDQLGLKALLAGDLDSYEGGVQGPIAADVRGANVKIIGCHWPLVPHGLMVKAGIGSVPELKGKAIAVSAPGSFPDLFARVALARFKLMPSDMTFAAIGGDRDRYNALIAGVVDAAVVSNEYLPLPSSKNFRMLVAGKEAGADFLRMCMFSTSKVLSERREDAIRYLAAQSKALRYALSHREETLKLTFEVSDSKPDDPRPGFVFDDAVKTGAITPDLAIPVDKIAWMQEQLVVLGQIPHAGDIAKMVDNEIRAEAMKRVGN